MTAETSTRADGNDAGKPRKGVNGRSVARLLAVQALYQMEITGTPVETVVEEFVNFRLDRDANRSLFLDLVRGVVTSKEALAELVGGALKDAARLERLEVVLRAIMMCGAYELRSRTDVPPRVTINEYVEVTHSFFGGKEPGLVNGVLDQLGRVLREDELGGRGDDTTAGAG